MKITKNYLKQVIKEEFVRMKEGNSANWDRPPAAGGKPRKHGIETGCICPSCRKEAGRRLFKAQQVKELLDVRAEMGEGPNNCIKNSETDLADLCNCSGCQESERTRNDALYSAIGSHGGWPPEADKAAHISPEQWRWANNGGRYDWEK